MRVLISVSDYSGHWFPMVAAGWALQAAGHETLVLCAPSQQAAVQRTGLTPLPVLGGPDMMERARIFYYFAAQQGGTDRLGMPLHPVTGQVLESLADFSWPDYKRDFRERNIAAIRASLDAAAETARDWRPDLVLHDVLSLEGILAAQVAGVPAACHLWGAIGTAETESGVNLVPLDHNNDFARHGVRAMSPRLIRHVVDPCPASLAGPTDAQRLAVRYTPYNGPGSEAAAPLGGAVRGGRPHVAVVWGNSLNGLIGPRSFLVPTILEALAELPVDVSLACAPEAAATLGSVPDNVRVLGYHPLRLLLPGSAAVIHHGGAGCAMTAVSAGVPQLALPYTPEQTTHATRVAATGAGLAFDGPTTPAAEIREAVVRLLDDSLFRVRAGELREAALGLPTAAELVGRLVDLAELDERGEVAESSEVRVPQPV